MRCPLCSSIDTGKVSTNQYYCWNCLIEFNLTGPDGYTAYHVDEEGTLVALNAPQSLEATVESAGELQAEDGLLTLASDV